jgi:uncharacterized RDD family membrane protein YckC
MSTSLRDNRVIDKVDDRDSGKNNEALDTMLLVETPEKISFQYQLVGPFRRAGSYILDLLVSVVGYTILVVIFGIAGGIIAAQLQGTIFASIVNAMLELSVAFILIGYFLVYWFYGAMMEHWYNGQTIGKMIMRFRVLSHDGHAIDGVQAMLRNFFRLLDLFPIVAFPLVDVFEFPIPTGICGLVAMSMNSRFQRLGDLVAGTIVVLDERKWVPELATFQDPRVAQLAEELPSDFVPTQSMLRTLADYVDRRRFLSPASANEMARELAPTMLQKFGLPMNTDNDLLLCAMYYNAFTQYKEGEVE